jgi:hypothetical protein
MPTPVVLDVLSNWAANAALELILPEGCFLSCHLSDPTPLGNTGSEVAGGGYIRQPISFAAATNRTRVSTNAQTFPGMPACVVTHLAVFTAIGGGHMVFVKKLNPVITVLASGWFIATVGDVALSL